MSNAAVAKVNAVNRANKYANYIYPLLREVFAPLVGQQVVKVNGDLLAKFEKLVSLHTPKNSGGLQVYRHRSDYSLAWVVKTCEMIQGTHSCVYHEVVVYIGNLRGQILTELCTPFQGRTDYTVSEVEENRKAYEAAKKAANEAQSKLWPFDEYDR